MDKVADCFKNYGDGVCNGQYKGWASTNCMKSCSICSESPAGAYATVSLYNRENKMQKKGGTFAISDVYLNIEL